MDGSDRKIGMIALAIGVILALVALLADVVGYGVQDGFGPGQIGLLIVGLAIAIYGFSRLRKV